MNFDMNYIDCVISSPQHPNSWRATGIYGYPKGQNKFLTCQLINDLSCLNNNPQWLLFGDFNLVLSSKEKAGGNILEPNITTSFRNTISHCDLHDLGYNGNIFTWTNRQDEIQLIQSRLDRFFANSNWIDMFPNFTNTHLTRYRSDHCPILLDFTHISCIRPPNQHYYGKRFEQIWTTNENHHNIVKEAWLTGQGDLGNKLKLTLNTLHNWGRKTFGIIPQRIKETQKELDDLLNSHNSQTQTNNIRNKEKELDDLLEMEELWWSQRSKAMWLAQGDKNTKFFHQKVSQRRKKNKIEGIGNSMGNNHTEQEDIEQIFVNHFKTLFTSQQTYNIPVVTQVVENRINQEMYEHLIKNFTAEEVYLAIKDMKSLAAPGPDGLPAKFYHHYWDILG
jgi:hypothetical protein